MVKIKKKDSEKGGASDKRTSALPIIIAIVGLLVVIGSIAALVSASTESKGTRITINASTRFGPVLDVDEDTCVAKGKMKDEIALWSYGQRLKSKGSVDVVISQFCLISMPSFKKVGPNFQIRIDPVDLHNDYTDSWWSSKTPDDVSSGDCIKADRPSPVIAMSLDKHNLICVVPAFQPGGAVRQSIYVPAKFFAPVLRQIPQEHVHG